MLIYESNLVNFPKRQHIKGKKKKKVRIWDRYIHVFQIHENKREI